MVTSEQFHIFKNRFATYIQSLRAKDHRVEQNFHVKTQHSLKVCEAIVTIGRALQLSDADLRLAQTIALFHDIGRFEQYTQYRTFSDSKSINHGLLGVEILKKYNFLQELPDATRDIVHFAVGHHNARQLPVHPDEKFLFLGKLIRDADKLDIFRVVADYYDEIQRGQNNPAVGLDLPNGDEISTKVLNDFLNGKIVDMKDLRTLNDFKVLQIGWLYDINFSPTLKSIRDGRHIEKIIATLPPTDQTQKIQTHACEFLDRKIL